MIWWAFLIEQFDLGKLKDDIRSRVVYIKNWQMHFSVRFSYLMNDNETVCLGNDEPSEYAGAKQARQILEQVAALFASGTMTNEDKTIFMDEMTRLYLASKKNRRKW